MTTNPKTFVRKLSELKEEIKTGTAPDWVKPYVDSFIKEGKYKTVGEYTVNGKKLRVDRNEDDEDDHILTIDSPFFVESKVYVTQEIPGTREGRPKINIIGASKYGELIFLLPELSQIIFSPGPLVFKLRKLLRDYTPEDYLLLTGDPAIIGVACSIVSDITNGKYKLLKWDKQERQYYPIEINLYEKGKIDE
jgi:hypothetical protein